jgi:hypothetical protein
VSFFLHKFWSLDWFWKNFNISENNKIKVKKLPRLVSKGISEAASDVGILKHFVTLNSNWKSISDSPNRMW